MTGKGNDLINLRRWTLIHIGGKDDITTIFVLAYWPYRSVNGLNTLWNQHVHYFQQQQDFKKPDVHALFIRDLCKALDNMRNEQYNVVFSIDVNNNVRDEEVAKALLETEIKESVKFSMLLCMSPLSCTVRQGNSLLI